MIERPFSDISYQQYLNEEQLMSSRCKRCGTFFLPPRPICMKCHGNEMEWVEMSGKGKLTTFSCIAIGPTFMMQNGHDRERPYCVGVVELEEGARVVAQFVGIDTSKPETIKIGLPLTVTYLHKGVGQNLRTFLAFKPLASS
jgi:uncharacterized OB-fold protein